MSAKRYWSLPIWTAQLCTKIPVYLHAWVRVCMCKEELRDPLPEQLFLRLDPSQVRDSLSKSNKRAFFSQVAPLSMHWQPTGSKCQGTQLLMGLSFGIEHLYATHHQPALPPSTMAHPWLQSSMCNTGQERARGSHWMSLILNLPYA